MYVSCFYMNMIFGWTRWATPASLDTHHSGACQDARSAKKGRCTWTQNPVFWYHILNLGLQCGILTMKHDHNFYTFIFKKSHCPGPRSRTFRNLIKNINTNWFLVLNYCFKYQTHVNAVCACNKLYYICFIWNGNDCTARLYFDVLRYAFRNAK